MKAGLHAIVMKINEDAQQHGQERYTQIKDAIDHDIDLENTVYKEESDKQCEALRKHNDYEYARRLEYQRSRLNRELLIYQHELADGVFDMAVSKLRDVSNDAFLIMLKKAVKGLRGSYTVHLGELSRGKLGDSALDEVMAENAGLEIVMDPATIPQKSGFMLRDDRVEYNHLFEDLVEDVKSERTAAIMKEIFGNSTDWMFS